MSPTVDEQAGSREDLDQHGIESFHLQVVSPSAGVNGPLSFPQLPVETTVKQLKEKIRETLPMRPSDDLQRLIHRGRLLARESETMSDIFGQETVCAPAILDYEEVLTLRFPNKLKATDTQTLHLVLKPSASDNVASSATRRSQTPDGIHRVPTPQRLPPDLERAAINQQNGSTAPPPNRAFPQAIRIPTPPQFIPPSPLQPFMPQRVLNNDQAPNNHQQHHPHPHHPQLHQHLNRDPNQQIALNLQQQLEHQHALLRHHQQQLFNNLRGQPPPVNPSFPNLIAQQQQNRAQLGLQGVQQDGVNTVPHTGQLGYPQAHISRGSYQPQQTRTTTQEINGPNGERWQVTVNETTTILPPNRPSTQASNAPAAELQSMVQNIVRAVDRNHIMQHSRPASPAPGVALNPSLAANFAREINRPASAPPPGTSNSMRDVAADVPTVSGTPAATGISSNPPAQVGPTVYILSSPSGPRALLVGNWENGVDAFYTPRQGISSVPRHLNQLDPLVNRTDRQQRREERAARHAQRNAEVARRLAAGPPPHPANPPAGAVAAQLGPRIWLVVRLLGFVWFFTSGNSSWWRTVMVSMLAFIVFIASTGMFNGVAEQLWGAFRRHLEALLPLAGPDGAHPAAPANDAAGPANPGAAAPAQGLADENAVANPAAAQAPDPAQAAARLLEQRRIANGNWVWTQFRRAEHAAILFLASLIPGVGERHIAARAAEENLVIEAQRQRREAEAAAAAASTTAAEGETGAGENEHTRDADIVPNLEAPESTDTPTQTSGENTSGDEPNTATSAPAVEGPAQPLIEV